MTNSKEYPAVDIKKPMIIFWFIIFSAISAYMILLATIISNIWLIILFSILSLLTPFMIYYSLTAKIIIDKQQVVKKSILGLRSLNFKDIKSFGLYKQEGKFARIIEEDELDKKDWFGQNFIFISDRSKYSPLFFRQKGSIRFHYYKELYDDIRKGIKACQ